jgi:hypothetical protein
MVNVWVRCFVAGVDSVAHTEHVPYNATEYANSAIIVHAQQEMENCEILLLYNF